MSLPLLVGKKRISLEMIDFQYDNFGADLELIVLEIQKKIIDNVYKDAKATEVSKEVRDLTNIIFERFGLKVKIYCNSKQAAILPFWINKNHILLDASSRGDFSIKKQDLIIQTLHERKGTVDIHKVKVSGIFSEYENLLFINFHILFGIFKLSVPQMVSVILHEVGHAFTACEYSNRLETTNQVLQNISQDIVKNKANASSIYIFRELKNINPKITEQEVDKLITGSKVVASLTWFKIVVGTVKEQMSNSSYSKTSSEQLSDGFAARFGYGRPLIESQDKMQRFFESEETSKSYRIVTEIIDAATYSMMILGTTIAFFTFIPAGLAGALVTYLMLRSSGDDYKDLTYDDLKDRYKRIRNESVEHLKDLKLSSAQIMVILDDIYAMDKIISNTYKYKGMVATLANFLFTDAKAANASIVEQRMLEDLATNDLFIASAELRTLNT